MPRKDATFSNRDLIRIFLNHLTDGERRKFIKTFRGITLELEKQTKTDLEIAEEIVNTVGELLDPLVGVPAIRVVRAALEAVETLIIFLQRK